MPPWPWTATSSRSSAAASQLTISGGLSGAGESLTVNGPGTVVLSGAGGYTGGTTVAAARW